MVDLLGDIIGGFGNIIFQIGILAMVGMVIFYKLGGKFSSKPKTVDRSEIVRKKMIQSLKMNKSTREIIVQDDKPVGILSRKMFYQENGKKLYLILYNPLMLNIGNRFAIPMFWANRVWAVSEDFIRKDLSDSKFLNFKVPIFAVTNGYFFDNWNKWVLAENDMIAMEFLKMKVHGDETEVTSSVLLAQAQRLTTVDFSKVFQPTAETVALEKLKQREEK